jgi:ABC-type branched-subunit amino acid transport system substrate-binding protein
VGSLTGPVPGLFRGALIGTQAYAAYINSQGGLFGRRIKVLPGDDGLDSGKNRAACLQLKDQVFSFVGSFSINDDGCNPVLQQCKCPDVGAALNFDHLAIPTTFSPQPQVKGWRTGAFNYYKQHFSNDVITHVAFFTAGVASARPIAAAERQVMESMGYKVVYSREVQPGEQNFTSDVIQMRQNGVKMVTMQGDAATMARISAEMEAQNFKVDLQDWGGSIYDDNSFKLAGKTALEGTLTDQTFAMFLGQDTKFVPEIATFKQWMARIDPNQPVDLFAFYGWLSSKLWTEAAKAVGPGLTRPKIVDTLSKIGAWDGGGLVAPVNIGQKKPSDCIFIFRIRNADFVREYPTDKLYDCSLGPFKYT